VEKLKQIRTRRGYSQQELADLADVAQHTISEIELGRRNPQGRTLRKIASALDVDITDLMQSESPKAAATQPDTPDSAHFDLERIIEMDEWEFGQYAETLDDDALQRVREQIDAEAARRPATNPQEIRRMGMQSFIAGLTLQVRKSEATREQAREQVAAIVAAV
jgi:transcriptional regulator with XRE-family HTH domain